MKTLTLIAGIAVSLVHNTMGEQWPNITVATYNTFQIPLNPLAAKTAPKIIEEISKSDIDIICLQEIFVASTALQFEKQLASSYPYAYSEADTLGLENAVAHAACNVDQRNKLKSDCITTKCALLFKTSPVHFLACASLSCQKDIFPLIDTECQSCLIAQTIGGSKSLSVAANICSQKVAINYAMTGGTMILSKYPIINKKIYKFPSNMMHRNIIFTEIDVSELTQPDAGQKDTIMFGCTHLVSTSRRQYFPTTQMEVDAGMTSYEQLNAWQANYILKTVELHSNHNALGVILAADLNVGYTGLPQNLQIWEDAGWFNAQRVSGVSTNAAACTYCSDPNGNNCDKNPLAIKACKGCKNADIDHILIYEDHLEHIYPFSYNRIFRDYFNIDGQMIPLSDHWGVMVEAWLI